MPTGTARVGRRSAASKSITNVSGWRRRPVLSACRRREREAHEREREKKREMAASEEYNTELGRKGKWPRSTQ